MNAIYECFLDEKRVINYIKLEDDESNKSKKYYTRFISIKNSIPKFLHKPIIFWHMIPDYNFSIYIQDTWPLNFTTKNTKISPHKIGRYLFQTYVKEGLPTTRQIYITHISDKYHIHKPYARLFNSPFYLNSVFTKFLAYVNCFPRYKFMHKDYIS